MPDILGDLLKQTCVYWPPTTQNPNKFGDYTPGTPVERNCRWKPKKAVILGPNSQEIQVSATVFLKEEVNENGWLMLIDLASAPVTPPDETRIKDVTRSPDIDNDEQLWTAMV